MSLDEGIAAFLDAGSEQLPGVFRKALRSGVLLAAIVRGGVTMIPSGMTTIEEGDHVLVIARSMGLKDLTDILA